MEKVSANHESDESAKKMGCWGRFKRMFEDRGFDLEYEYNDTRSTTVLNENSDGESTKKPERINIRTSVTLESDTDSMDIDGELSGVINFYEQFAVLGDDTKDEEQSWRKSTGLRPRVSMRPSMHLTNIIEETSSLGDPDMFETEVVSIIDSSQIAK